MYLIFDTETTGLPSNFNAPYTATDVWPRVVQIAWQLHDEYGQLIEAKDFIIKPDGYNIPFESEQIHGISTALAETSGVMFTDAAEEFLSALSRAKFVVGQNIGFDINVVGCEFFRYGIESPLHDLPVLDTCTEVTAGLTQIPGGRGGRFKLPNLTELHKYLFGEGFGEAHNATADVEATTRCFFELIRQEVFTLQELQASGDYYESYKSIQNGPVQPIGLKHLNLKRESDKLREKSDSGLSKKELDENVESLKEVKFAHLHNHSQYSILQSTTAIRDLVAAAIKDGQPAVAMTDLGNMMGAFHFVKAALDHNKSVEAKLKEAEESGEVVVDDRIKPIIGCELFVCKNHLDKTQKDSGYQVPFLALNKKGYHNLAKLSSIGYIDGFYYVPRVDKDLIIAHKEGIVALTGGLQGEIPQLILNVGEKQAEEAFLWYKEQFGENFYVEINRHGLPEEDVVNNVLLRLAETHNVPCIAANNTFYLSKEDAPAHDILLCVKDGEKQSTPIGRGRGYRNGFPNNEFYFKSQEEMKRIFRDLPQAVEEIGKLIKRVEVFTLAREVLLPKFDIPAEFQDPQDDVDGGKRGENAYLRHLTYVGAEKRYSEITDDIKERLDFELATIENTGYPGYFLIVQDFCQAARDMGVSVGPGRGSAAGSAVAFCIGITNVDPIKYDLLFERFLNPDRVSLPDIDIDFDDRGREKVIQYVIDKYGASQVAQIITYGTMAAKSSIKDTARVLDLPFDVANRLTGLMPDISLGKLFSMDDASLKGKLRPEDYDRAIQMKELAKGESEEAVTLNQATILEGSVRNTGIHACGVIITPSDIRELIPVSTAKDSSMWCTQFDNSVVESAGLLKMDFLGLKTLTLIKDTLSMVKDRHGVDIDIEAIPLDDEKTYQLFQRGETIGIFQYESPGMQKHLKDLKPTVFGDLIAMNALYRPGPLEYIPSFIRRKHGVEPITYDLEGMEQYLQETYGITVYQEQVMLLSQSLAGFTKGEADMLRKAMGKKIFALLQQLKPKFIDGGVERGHNPDVLEKVWKDWEAFASYAFNKSHSTCYAWVAYQTAYLKAHYPAEYMAAVLSNNLSDNKQVAFFMEECKRMQIPVLGPDVNESQYTFTVNKDGAIRFGLGGMRGVGVSAVDHLIETRNEAAFKGFFDMIKRVDLRIVNRKTLESLALGGAFDGFPGEHRAMYFHDDGDGKSFMEKAIKYAHNVKESENSSQVSLFGEASGVDIPEPPLPQVEPWVRIMSLKREKEINGLYLSSHPLDDYRYELNAWVNCPLSNFQDLERLINAGLSVAGIITKTEFMITRNGKDMAKFTVEDFDGAYEFTLFGESCLKFKHFLNQDQLIFMRCKVVKKSFGKDDKTFERINIDIHEMRLLQDVLGEMSKSVELTMPLENVNGEVLNRLTQTIQEFPGKKKLSFKVYDPLESLVVTMPSRKLRVDITKDLLDQLNRIPNVMVKLQ